MGSIEPFFQVEPLGRIPGPSRPQAAARPPVGERRHGGPALTPGGRPSKHDRLAAARQEAQGDRLRRHDHPGGLRPAEGVPAAEPGLAAPVVGGGVGIGTREFSALF